MKLKKITNETPDSHTFEAEISTVKNKNKSIWFQEKYLRADDTMYKIINAKSKKKNVELLINQWDQECEERELKSREI